MAARHLDWDYTRDLLSLSLSPFAGGALLRCAGVSWVRLIEVLGKLGALTSSYGLARASRFDVQWRHLATQS
jgi:hypothetical protein